MASAGSTGRRSPRAGRRAGGQRWPCPAPAGVVSRFHLEVLMALCLVIRPHLPAQCKRRRPGWTLPPKSSVGQFDSQPASVLCSSFPGQPPHPMSLSGRCIVLGTSQRPLGAGQRAGRSFGLGHLTRLFFFLMLASDRRAHSPLVYAGGKGLFWRQLHNHQHHDRHQDGQQAINAPIHPSIRPSIPPAIGPGQAQSSLSACIQAVEIDVRYPFRLQR